MNLTITGMRCPHCKSAVEGALKALSGVEAVTIDVDQGTATVTGNATESAVIAAIKEAGYDASIR